MDSNRFIILLLGLLITNNIFCQTDKKIHIWHDAIRTDYSFDSFNIEFLKDKDLSNIISNKIRFDGDPLMYYSGVFGTNYTRIDFHFSATKKDSLSLDYQITGFNRLGANIRPINGLMKVTDLFMYKENYGANVLYLVVLDCKFYEPGDKNGDGYFSGIYTTIFYVENNDIKWIYSESGDFSKYNCVFVGSWQKYNTDNLKSTIFSFNPIGLYNELPMCEEFYKTHYNCDDYVIPKNKYVKNGWINYLTEKRIQWWNSE